MKNDISAKEYFRKGFVLIMTLAYAVAFLALIGGFLEALLLAEVQWNCLSNVFVFSKSYGRA